MNFLSIEELLDEKYLFLITPKYRIKTNETNDEGKYQVISQDLKYNIGYVDFIDERLTNPPYIIFGDHTECIKYVETCFLQGADGIKIFKTNEQKLNPLFFYYALLIYYHKTGFYERHYKIFKKTLIPIPDINIQNEICERINCYDQLINNNYKTIELINKIIENCYLKHFNYTFSDIAYICKNNKIPNGWKLNYFKDIVSYDQGISYTSKDLVEDGGINFINLKNIKSFGGFSNEGIKKVANIFKDSSYVRPGDLIMGVTDMTQERRTIGYTAIIPQDLEGLISCDLIKLRSNLNNRFLYCLLSFGKYSKFFSLLGNGTNVLHLRPSSLDYQLLLIPNDTMIEKFLYEVDPLFDYLEILNKQNKKLQSIKDNSLINEFNFIGG